jgi:hypothetical protein
MSHFLSVELPGDLPQKWTEDQFVAPEGTDVGLTEQHGYNYLNKQVNNSHKATNELSKVVCSGIDNLLDNWHFESPINEPKGYCVKLYTTYYKDTALTQSAGSTTGVVAAKYVNTTYGTIMVNGTEYYVKYSAMYEGHVPEGTGAYTFNRWYARACSIVFDPSYRGFTVKPASEYVSGFIRQVVNNPAAVAGKQVILSVLVKSLSKGTSDAYMHIASASSINAANVTQHGKTKLVEGMNTLIVNIPANAGSAASPYLFVTIESITGSSMLITAAKLQLGSVQTLAYQNAQGNWDLREVPNRTLDYIRCTSAPTEIGGTGTIATTHLANATVE